MELELNCESGWRGTAQKSEPLPTGFRWAQNWCSSFPVLKCAKDGRLDMAHFIFDVCNGFQRFSGSCGCHDFNFTSIPAFIECFGSPILTDRVYKVPIHEAALLLTMRLFCQVVIMTTEQNLGLGHKHARAALRHHQPAYSGHNPQQAARGQVLARTCA